MALVCQRQSMCGKVFDKALGHSPKNFVKLPADETCCGMVLSAILIDAPRSIRWQWSRNKSSTIHQRFAALNASVGAMILWLVG